MATGWTTIVFTEAVQMVEIVQGYQKMLTSFAFHKPLRMYILSYTLKRANVFIIKNDEKR